MAYLQCFPLLLYLVKQPIAGGRGLIFQGEAGLGKTHLIAAIVNELQRRLIFSYFLSVPLFLERVRDSFDDENTSEGKVMRVVQSGACGNKPGRQGLGQRLWFTDRGPPV